MRNITIKQIKTREMMKQNSNWKEKDKRVNKASAGEASKQTQDDRVRITTRH